MKIKSGYVLFTMGDEYVVVPADERTNEFHGMVTLNETGAFLWEQMENNFTVDSLKTALLNKYDVSSSDAELAVNSFISQVSELIENE